MGEDRAAARGGLTLCSQPERGVLRGGHEIKMPGSLSNEDEGQDDMDFEDDLPGEGMGRGGPFRLFVRRSAALNAGKRACPVFLRPEEEEECCNK